MSAHARLAPSAAKQWAACPASVTMQERYPDEGEDGLAGEASHWVGSELLLGRVHNQGETAPNGVVLDAEMVHGAQLYAKHVADRSMGCGLYVEQPIACAGIHPECWGTPDVWWYNRQAQEIHIPDYKYGWGIVEAVRNPQLTVYACGVIDFLAGHQGVGYGILDQQVTVVFHIVQPRPYHHLGPIREWRINGAELRGRINILRVAAAEALGPNPRCIAGPQCRYCKARHDCGALRAAAYAAFEYVEAARPGGLSPEAVAAELQILERAQQAIEYLTTGVRAQAVSLLTAGASVPGWSLDRGQGREQWRKDVDAKQIFAMGDLMGVQVRAPEAPVTPAQARKAGLPAEVVNSFTERPAGEPKLVRTDNTKAAMLLGMAVGG